MLENLIQLVKEHAGDAIVNNSAIPNEHNEAAISTAATGIMDHLKGLASGGNLDKIKSMFSGGNVADNSEVSTMSNNIAGNLMSKFGISAEQAGSVVKNLIPNVMSKLASKTNDPNDKSFDMQGIIGSLTSGGGISGIMDKMKSVFQK